MRNLFTKIFHNEPLDTAGGIVVASIVTAIVLTVLTSYSGDFSISFLSATPTPPPSYEEVLAALPPSHDDTYIVYSDNKQKAPTPTQHSNQNLFGSIFSLIGDFFK